MLDYSPWLLDPDITYLNHGSFGACPAPVLDAQTELRARMEAEPVRFFTRELPALLAAARQALGRLVGAAADDLAFVPNATAGVNTALASLELEPGDELLITDHAYGACKNALQFYARRHGARVVVARIPFPLAAPEQATDAVLAAATARTRLALLDHVTSPTALVLPAAEMVRALAERGLPSLVDGAHAPGMIPLSVAELGAAFYVGNCHKWLCAPKGAGFLWVRPDLRETVRPLSISHGAGAPAPDRFRLEMDWTGTVDPTAWLSLPAAIDFMGALLPGGFAELMARNRKLALEARRLLAAALEIPLPCPDSMVGSMAALPLWPSGVDFSPWPEERDPLKEALIGEHGIEVPVIPWPAHPRRLLRFSAQFYNRIEQYDALKIALAQHEDL